MIDLKNLKIITYPNKVLRQKCEEVQDFESMDLEELYKQMKIFLNKEDGIGLAATQVGLPIQVMLIKPDSKKDYFLINPKITFYSKKKSYGIEGCLSFPKVFGSVLRSNKIKIEAQDITGKKVVFQAKSLPARVIQHEYDHLQGVLYIDKMENILEGREELERMKQSTDDTTIL